MYTFIHKYTSLQYTILHCWTIYIYVQSKIVSVQGYYRIIALKMFYFLNNEHEFSLIDPKINFILLHIYFIVKYNSDLSFVRFT